MDDDVGKVSVSTGLVVDRLAGLQRRIGQLDHPATDLLAGLAVFAACLLVPVSVINAVIEIDNLDLSIRRKCNEIKYQGLSQSHLTSGLSVRFRHSFSPMISQSQAYLPFELEVQRVKRYVPHH